MKNARARRAKLLLLSTKYAKLSRSRRRRRCLFVYFASATFRLVVAYLTGHTLGCHFCMCKDCCVASAVSSFHSTLTVIE